MKDRKKWGKRGQSKEARERERERASLLGVVGEQRQVQYQGYPVPVDEEEGGEEGVDAGFGHDVGVESVTEVDGVDVVAGVLGSFALALFSSLVPTSEDAGEGEKKEGRENWRCMYHSRSLYMIVKKTWRKRLTAFMSTERRYSHASPDIIWKGRGG